MTPGLVKDPFSGRAGVNSARFGLIGLLDFNIN